VLEKDHEPLPPQIALAEERFGETGSPNDNGYGSRAPVPKGGRSPKD
jgi:hypothetical protein